MPSFLLKAKRDADFYVEWSTVVDNATRCGTRAEMVGMLGAGNTVPRLDRADVTGTSCLDPDYRFGAWEDEDFIVTNTNRRDAHFFTLKRSDLFAYASAGIDTPEAEALLAPIPDEGDADA